MADLDPADFDPETGRWLGICENCGTDHGGWPPGTTGAAVFCVRGAAAALFTAGGVELSRLADRWRWWRRG